MYIRTENMVLRTVAGENILIPIARRPENYDCVFLLNDTSRELWQWLSTPRSAANLTELLAEEFDRPQNELHSDVQTFLTAMSEMGAIQEV